MKSKLAGIRSHCRDCIVFAFEGIEDKTIYFHWLRQINPGMKYEFLVCSGKAQVLEFRELLRRDLTGLRDSIFFFVDRDFDDLRGVEFGDDIFMTETYSIENQLVCHKVLEGIMNVDLHCHGEPECRRTVLRKFDELYDSFLSITEALNRRIFLARTLSIRNSKPFPDKIRLLANVELLHVSSTDLDPMQIVVLDREPTEQEVSAHEDAFKTLNRRDRYRGKFALLFFQRWLELLGEERNKPDSEIFKGLERKNTANGRLSLDSLAAKSVPPEGFKNFIDRIFSKLPATPEVSVI
ncbi:DUF4435 domain-containing protein [Roseateles flavus]|uniref:DUF4435 domain-containing protein n=1 Tax=Roseateles flavus TaxID=3149041 RepID=A0ABV0GDD7_9BURK